MGESADGVPRGCVVHVWDRVVGAAYIGRGYRKHGIYRDASPLYNPFIIGYHHDSIPRHRGLSREEVVGLYEQYLRERPFLLRKLPDLRGKPLECWCRHAGEIPVRSKNLCHGDVILKILAEYTDEELKEMR